MTKSRKIGFLPDQPIEDSLQEALGFREFVTLIQESIYSTDPPFVYGLLGDWGTGKTSILKLLANELQKELDLGNNPYIPIWFNAWHYENEAKSIFPLLHTINRDYENRIKLTDNINDFKQSFINVVTASTLALTDITLRAASKNILGEAITLLDIDQHIKNVKSRPSKLEQTLSLWADQVTTLQVCYDSLLTLYAKDYVRQERRYKEEDVKFVIIIDDLDRCLPETTISFLESIKNYLLTRRCIYILGLNSKVIYQGIRIKYHNLDIDGREYLEKILNYSFYVPEPNKTDLNSFTQRCLENLIKDQEIKIEYKAYIDLFSRIVCECQFSNPRKIKRILNHYLFYINRYYSCLDDYDLQNAVRLIILAEYFPSLFQIFLNDKNFNNDDFNNLFLGKDSVTQFEKKYNVSIASIYPQLQKMKSLFSLQENLNLRKKNLSEQALAVNQLLRLV